MTEEITQKSIARIVSPILVGCDEKALRRDLFYSYGIFGGSLNRLTAREKAVRLAFLTHSQIPAARSEEYLRQLMGLALRAKYWAGKGEQNLVYVDSGPHCPGRVAKRIIYRSPLS